MDEVFGGGAGEIGVWGRDMEADVVVEHLGLIGKDSGAAGSIDVEGVVEGELPGAEGALAGEVVHVAGDDG